VPEGRRSTWWAGCGSVCAVRWERGSAVQSDRSLRFPFGLGAVFRRGHFHESGRVPESPFRSGWYSGNRRRTGTRQPSGGSRGYFPQRVGDPPGDGAFLRPRALTSGGALAVFVRLPRSAISGRPMVATSASACATGPLTGSKGPTSPLKRLRAPTTSFRRRMGRDWTAAKPLRRASATKRGQRWHGCPGRGWWRERLGGSTPGDEEPGDDRIRVVQAQPAAGFGGARRGFEEGVEPRAVPEADRCEGRRR
jgi:hypothetical protein